MHSRRPSKRKDKEKLLRYYSKWAHSNFHSYGEVLRGSVHWAPNNCSRIVPLQIVRARFRSHHNLTGIHLKNPGLLIIINSWCTYLSRDEDVGARNCSLPASEKRRRKWNSLGADVLRRRSQSNKPRSSETDEPIECWNIKVGIEDIFCFTQITIMLSSLQMQNLKEPCTAQIWRRYIFKSQNHRMVDVGRDFWRSSGQPPSSSWDT